MEQTEQEMRDEIGAEVYGMEPPETPVDESLPETPETEDPKPDEIEDPLSGLDPALRQSIKSMEERLGEFDNVSHRLKQAERRIGSLTNELSAAKKEVPTKQEIKEAVKSGKWDELKEDYPEIGEAVGEKLEGELKAIRDSISSAPDFDAKLKAETDRLNSEFEKKLEIITLRTAHSDYQEIIASKDYQDWLNAQPPQVQRLTTSPKAKDAIAILNSFKGRTKPADIKNKRKQRLEEAETVKGKKLVPPKSEDTMTNDEYRAKVAKRLWG